MAMKGGTTSQRKKRKEERAKAIEKSKQPGERAYREKGSVSGKDRLELAQSRAGGGQEHKLKDGEIVGTTASERREAEIQATAKKGLDIEEAKKGIVSEKFETETPTEAITPKQTFKEKGKTREQNEIMNIQNQLAQPETNKTLDKINRWRLNIKLDNLQTRDILGGTLPIGIPASAVTTIGGSAWRGVGQLVGTPTTGGLIGSTVTNAKTVALTGSWLQKAGFTIKASAFLGGLISLTAWGKHVKAEAIEFLPYQIQESQKAGDTQSVEELKQMFEEINNPTGWKNIIEEIPGLGVIKASLDKTRAGALTIKAIERRG